MLTKSEIESGFVYENASGERRLVASIDTGRAAPVVMWRTPDPELPKEARAQGSCTVGSFARWASSKQRATTEDYAAFDAVERRRNWHARDRQDVRCIKRAKAKAKAKA